jgi:hypothetical protein
MRTIASAVPVPPDESLIDARGDNEGVTGVFSPEPRHTQQQCD